VICGLSVFLFSMNEIAARFSEGHYVATQEKVFMNSYSVRAHLSLKTPMSHCRSQILQAGQK